MQYPPTGGSKFRSTYGNLTSRTRDTQDKKPKDPHPIDISPSESQERINEEFGIPLKIWQHQEVQVTSEEVGPSRHPSLSDKSDKSDKSVPGDGTLPDLTGNDRRTPGMGFTTQVGHAI